MEFGEFVYCLKDNRTGKFRQNLFVSVLDPEHYRNAWKESYLTTDPNHHEAYVDVFLIGQFDHDTGFIKPSEPVLIVEGLDCEHSYQKMVARMEPLLTKAREVN